MTPRLSKVTIHIEHDNRTDLRTLVSHTRFMFRRIVNVYGTPEITIRYTYKGTRVKLSANDTEEDVLRRYAAAVQRKGYLLDAKARQQAQHE